MNALQAFVLSKKFTEETAIEFGAVKGANCEVTSIEEGNGEHIVTFKWTNSYGETRTSSIVIKDGDAILEWISGTTYEYGSVVIYQDCFYFCTVTNSDATFNRNKWKAIGSADGVFSLVDDSSYLPQHLAAHDREMYYSIADEAFWLWNGAEWVIQSSIKPLTNNQLDNLIKIIK